MVQDVENRSHLVKQSKEAPQVTKPSQREKGTPTARVYPLTHAVPKAVCGALDRMVTNKPLIGQFLKLFKLRLKASSYFLVYPGIRGEEADHHGFLGGFMDGPAKEA